MDIARWQLKKAIAQLPEGTEFNVIFFSHEVVALSDKMLKMSASARKPGVALQPWNRYCMATVISPHLPPRTSWKRVAKAASGPSGLASYCKF